MNDTIKLWLFLSGALANVILLYYIASRVLYYLLTLANSIYNYILLCFGVKREITWETYMGDWKEPGNQPLNNRTEPNHPNQNGSMCGFVRVKNHLTKCTKVL